MPKKNLEDLARKLGIGPYANKNTGSSDGQGQDEPKSSIKIDGNYFTFFNVPYAPDNVGNVSLTKELVDGKQNKNHDAWREWSKTPANKEVVPHVRIVYQLMRCLYETRDNPDLEEVRNACLAIFREDIAKKVPHTGTKIKYGAGLEATINHLESDKTNSSINVDIPEFEVYKDNDSWSYLVLAKEQPESELGTVEQIPEEAKPFLEALLGEGYEQVGAICQYIDSLNDNGNLREIRLWMPSKKARNCERAVVLGRYVVSYGFSIDCDDDVGYVRPARGVVVVGAPK